ncbi:MAG TPA: hypothetical protein VKE94_00955, partial [Gemmataceae bacterium]|nr:hypothetical protein [Gemmataceae bacterium]
KIGASHKVPGDRSMSREEQLRPRAFAAGNGERRGTADNPGLKVGQDATPLGRTARILGRDGREKG